ncbi:polysaccharide deacetylase family protein [Paenibacillus sp. KQZ6P-2]|uniref:Polysaccharide deacetylase family protein n=1 Tax=Paenibacillus mangrovi TaxID=2931978 RepID=A0A9X1WMG3_9BACL|nr:polysaccharide deacetylase [Paenibacillus mangrovi]MCJ8010333.1 polysaccharide deacetylase family protein [Paenibacillus mangrovi]
MKKLLQCSKWVLSFVLIFSCVFSAGQITATAEGSSVDTVKYSVFAAVNDTLITYPMSPVIHKGTLYVPIVQTAAAMNVTVQYSKGNVTLTHSGGKSVTLPANGSNTFVKNGRTFIAFRVISEKFGFKLSYLPQQNVYRALNSGAKLTDAQFAAKYSSYIQQHKAVTPPPAKPSKPESGKGSKTIYITFDDGPSPYTPQLLNVLKQYNVKATFFMLGNQIASHPASTARIVKEGHGVGLHGMTHQKNKFYASPYSALNEMNMDNKKLHDAAGVYTKLIRVPYGSKPYFTKSYRDQTAAAGYHLWDWNVDSNDWRYQSNPQTIYNNVMRDIKNMEKKGVTPIVLFHDQKATVSILPKVIKSIQAEGYTFKPITNDMTPMNFWHDER